MVLQKNETEIFLYLKAKYPHTTFSMVCGQSYNLPHGPLLTEVKAYTHN